MAEEIESDDAPQPAPQKKGQSPLGFVLALLGVTILGGGAGALLSSWQFDTIESAVKERANAEPVRTESALAWDEASAIARLEPVVTNLAEPNSAWVRVDTAMIFDHASVDDVERMKAEVAQSVLAFLRTVTLSELQGASALNHLRDDLNERVRMASSGAVRELLIETMVIQ